MRNWSSRSKTELNGVHKDLRAICELALELSKFDFVIIDGMRTIAEQKKHVANGASKTMNSRHLYGLAVDVGVLVDGKIRWEESYYKVVAEAFLLAAKKLKVPLVWGGIWKWKDWGHFELSRSAYPDPK